MMQLTSSAFAEGGNIPSKYTCDGHDTSPPLQIAGVPAEAKMLALLVEDPDAPHGTFTHWLLWSIDPKTKELPEGHTPKEARAVRNDFGHAAYNGPCPPSGTHRYYFRLVALDAAPLPAPPGGKGFRQAIAGHVLAETALMGRYTRAK